MRTWFPVGDGSLKSWVGPVVSFLPLSSAHFFEKAGRFGELSVLVSTAVHDVEQPPHSDVIGVVQPQGSTAANALAGEVSVAHTVFRTGYKNQYNNPDPCEPSKPETTANCM